MYVANKKLDIVQKKRMNFYKVLEKHFCSLWILSSVNQEVVYESKQYGLFIAYCVDCNSSKEICRKENKNKI